MIHSFQSNEEFLLQILGFLIWANFGSINGEAWCLEAAGSGEGVCGYKHPGEDSGEKLLLIVDFGGKGLSITSRLIGFAFWFLLHYFD